MLQEHRGDGGKKGDGDDGCVLSTVHDVIS